MNESFSVAVVALWVAFILQSILVLALFRYVGMLVRRLPPESLRIDERAPIRQVRDTNGEQYVLGKPSERNRMLIFISPKCPYCERIMPSLAPFAAQEREKLEMLIDSSVELSPEKKDALLTRLNGDDLLRLIVSPTLTRAYKVSGTPYGIVLDQEGIVRATGVTSRPSYLRALLDFRVDGKETAESRSPSRPRANKQELNEPILVDKRR